MTRQTYPADQIAAGQRLFTAQCGFCHGRDAMGGESGPDLTRATLVAEDVRGDKLGPLLRSGRVDKGMPAFTLSAADLSAIVAFVHDQKTKAESLTGGRRTVDVADLQTGDPEAGRKYFAGACVKCHSATPAISPAWASGCKVSRCCSACSIPLQDVGDRKPRSW
jgi:cytochrome c oxidase cbb3-type subunit III